MNLERPEPIRQYPKEDKPCIVLAPTYSSFIEWTESQEEDIARLSIYCAGTPFRKLVNKTPEYYGLVVLPNWYRASKEYKEEVYNLLTQLGFKHQHLKGHIELIK